jgi:hypothetical protein
VADLRLLISPPPLLRLPRLRPLMVGLQPPNQRVNYVMELKSQRQVCDLDTNGIATAQQGGTHDGLALAPNRPAPMIRYETPITLPVKHHKVSNTNGLEPFGNLSHLNNSNRGQGKVV